MRVLFVSADYEDYLSWLYSSDRELATLSYATQLQRRRENFFAGPDGIASALRSRGHEAHEIYVNNGLLQAAWAQEYLPSAGGSWARRRAGLVEWARGVARSLERLAPPGGGARRFGRRLLKIDSVSLQILQAQVQDFRPDIIVNMAMESLSPTSLSVLNGGHLIGWNAHSALRGDYSDYELVLSPIPETVRLFESNGVRGRLLPLGFDERVLERISPTTREHSLTFVGNLHAVHAPRLDFLRHVAQHFPQLQVWGPIDGQLDRHDPLFSKHCGPAWGLEMYRVLMSSKVTLNHHGSIRYANNSRLFEATGCGTLLLSDAIEGLSDYFDVGTEILAYESTENAVECLEELLDERSLDTRRISAKGQARTLRDHSLGRRAASFEEIVASL